VITDLAGEYRGRSVFISGGSSGVGAALGQLLARLGAHVTLFARSKQRLDDVVGEIKSAGGSALGIAGDVRSSADVETAIALCISTFGPLAIAVANAGIGDRCPLEKLDDATWNSIVETNLTGAFWVCRAAGLHMREVGGGSIITIASGLGLVGMAGQVAYCASKGGMVLMTKALAAELAPTVRVNCFAPGGIETPMTDSDFAVTADPAEARRRALARVPLARLAAVEEVAQAIAWTASGAFSYATGSIVSMDGGTTAV
jgi:NAD(P)-dependent dehydrogenase (short-subunit alcohol dehydrogenase family)